MPQTRSVYFLCYVLVHPGGDRSEVIPDEGSILTPPLSDDKIEILKDRSIGPWCICLRPGNLSDKPRHAQLRGIMSTSRVLIGERGTINSPRRKVGREKKTDAKWFRDIAVLTSALRPTVDRLPREPRLPTNACPDPLEYTADSLHATGMAEGSSVARR